MMDNCLASNSETGGVGCDNMTMIVIGFLNGKTKQEWYDMIGKRVADGDGPCAPPEYGKFFSVPSGQVFANYLPQLNSVVPVFAISLKTTVLMSTSLTWIKERVDMEVGAGGLSSLGMAHKC